MIAKCIAILAIVAQINALGCNQAAVVVPTCTRTQGAAVVVPTCTRTQGAAVALPAVGNGNVISRNIVAKGKYPVALNCGPVPDRRVPVTTTRVTTPVQQKPTVRLPCNIPAPRTVAHSCTCYKTIVRPRVHDQYITVPTIQRYIETSHTPVVENIHYEGVPVNCPSTNQCGTSAAVVSAVPVVPAVSAVSAVPAVPVVPAVSAVRVSQPVSLGYKSCVC